jgi:predicted CoA-binding protein
MKRTLIIGASTNPERYSFKAANMLTRYGHEIAQLGLKTGIVAENEIMVGKPDLKDIDTVTLYLNAQNQKEWYDYILKLKPKRIIFNPGTENMELEELAKKNGIEPMEACTLVLLSTAQY